MSNVDKLLGSLEKVRQSAPGKWSACCPAHDDKGPSLAIKELDDGRILIHCFAGCAANDVLGAVGLSMSDLFPERLGDAMRPVSWRPTMRTDDALRSLVKDAYCVGIIAANMNDFGEISDEDRALLITCISRMDSALIASGVQR